MRAPRSRGRLARLIAPDRPTVVFRVLWALLILWTEIGSFWWSLVGCRWPDRVFTKSKLKLEKPTHVLLVSDVKVPPPISGSRTLRNVMSDVYQRKAWSAATGLRPHVVVFLGDTLSAGSSMESDNEFRKYVDYFHTTYPLDPRIETIYIPGNSDVGLGVSSAFASRVHKRYVKYFGPLNQRHLLANHSLVAIDAPGLVDEDYVRAARGIPFDQWPPLPDGPVEFVKRLAEEGRPEPVVLLSHIPLHRPESRKCGPLRERGTSIQRGAGPGWQTTLEKHTTRFLLQSLSPVAIFSGDNRDYCDIAHALPSGKGEVHEITLKSFSPSRHITRPGFQLLSLLPHENTPEHATDYCLLPSTHSGVKSVYIPFLILQCIFIVIAHLRSGRSSDSPLPSYSDSPREKSHSRADSWSAPGNYNSEQTRRGRNGPWLDPFAPSMQSALSPDIDAPPSMQSPVAARRPRLRVPIADRGPQTGGQFAWTFTFRGQRRRVGFRLPTAMDGRASSGVSRAVLRGLVRTLWVPGTLWMALLWWYA
ncbi:unnamed protein product [Peniophora sp. CBMAI 1063]|nr:unnamed protein product [Peniophora sp. CBMAI 1063]